MNRKWFHEAGGWLRRHKLLLGVLSVPMVVLGFALAEHVRGSISLARYTRALSAQGEKMTAREFMLPRPTGENGAPEVMSAAKDLKPGFILPTNPPPRMRLTPAGRGIVCFREEEWVDFRVTNRWEQLAEDLASNEATFERIRTSMAKPELNCDFDPSLGPRARFPHLSVGKTLTYWLGSRIALRLHEGKSRETVPDLVTEIDLPRLLARDGIVISELVRIAIAAIAKGDTWEALQADGWRDEDLAELQRTWERQEFASAMARALEGERVFAESTYQLMRKSNEETAAILFWMEDYMPGEERPAWEQRLRDLPGGETAADCLKKQVYCRWWRFAWLDQDQLHYLKYLERLIALGREAVREKSFKKAGSAADELVLKFQNRGIYNRLRYRSEMSVASLSRVLTKAMRAETDRSLVVTAIALKRYALRHGGPPQSLSALVPEFLASVPVDYMDGQALRFHAERDGNFVLYSVGEDGKDDGGDSSLLPGKTHPRIIWEHRDVVWPAPATAEEVEAYRQESLK
jgi:hypothetical protein